MCGAVAAVQRVATRRGAARSGSASPAGTHKAVRLVLPRTAACRDAPPRVADGRAQQVGDAPPRAADGRVGVAGGRRTAVCCQTLTARRKTGETGCSCTARAPRASHARCAAVTRKPAARTPVTSHSEPPARRALGTQRAQTGTPRAQTGTPRRARGDGVVRAGSTAGGARRAPRERERAAPPAGDVAWGEPATSLATRAPSPPHTARARGGGQACLIRISSV